MFGRGSRDPAHGLRVNKLSDNSRVSKKIYQCDIARTHIIIKDLNDRVDIQGKAYYVNFSRRFVDYRQDRVEGRF